jgi:ribulose-5-phosphate 4-epimerase/fuculose-1-phosphate aldolase
MPEEGVIKFGLDYTRSPPDPALDIHALSALRQRLWRLGLVGQAADRYGGVGYGNVSRRIRPGELPFLVSGSQTGAREWLGPEHYARVTGCDVQHNRVTATGPIPPSSESLTHGMIYALLEDMQVVLHVHTPELWEQAAKLGLPMSDPHVAYGTPAMAEEVARLLRDPDTPARGLLAMGGHRDGVIAFGETVQAAGSRLLDAWKRAAA